MKYHVCVQNCFQDYFYENLSSISFPTLEAAKEYIDKVEFQTFDINGQITNYMADLSVERETAEDEDDESRSELDCYQIINVIPSDKETESIEECYGADDRNVFSITRSYTLDDTGDVSWHHW